MHDILKVAPVTAMPEGENRRAGKENFLIKVKYAHLADFIIWI